MKIEVHGFGQCPFSWRVRIAAALKGVAFDWIPTDDPRSPQHNPDKRSPLLYHDGFTLTDSAVITSYLDEAFEGPPLQASTAKDRALARLAVGQLDGLYVMPDPPPEKRKGAEDALARLDKLLADGRAYLDGDRPGLTDAFAWPGLSIVSRREIPIPEGLAAARAYWERVQAHDAYVSTQAGKS